ncbi:MAG: sensor histidine kinase [Blautia sp.]|jgi:two-component system sensor histidine kinase VanS
MIHTKSRASRRHSLRSQIAIIFILLILVTLASIILINGFFLEDYYVAKKTSVLKSVFQELQDYIPEDVQDSGEDGQAEGEEGDDRKKQEESIPEDLVKISTENNLNWVLLDPQTEYVAGFGQRAEIMASRLFGYIYGIEKTEAKVLEETDRYVIQKSKDRFVGMDYVEMWGVLDNGNVCLIRSPLESIRESVSISNGFFVYVGLGILAVSGLLIWVVTKRITRPISELTELSKQMTELDFDAKYQSVTHNEIDVLGENFNKMSIQLERTIQELRQANQQLQADIEEKIKIDEMRKEFLNNVSHELKTPIALIQGYAEGLKENISDDPESMDFYCEVIIDESAKMNTMVRSLLNLNQLESGQDMLTLEVFNLCDLVQGVIQASQILIQQKEAKVTFAREQEYYVRGDEFKIEEVVTNYLTNALNHLDENKIIEIKIVKSEDKVRLSVFNTGQPIPDESLPQLWNKFYKVDKARTREYGGSGIGLSIVKAIMDSHHQECGVRNFENGVEFWAEWEAWEAPGKEN